MTAKVRTFDFDRETTFSAALRTVRAALDDEGLALSDANTTGDRPYSVLLPVDGRTVRRVFVPASRIVLQRPSLHVVR